jgi:hypothetical protein
MANKYLKKMLYISRHQGNANQNYIEIPYHSSQMNITKQKAKTKQMLARM